MSGKEGGLGLVNVVPLWLVLLVEFPFFDMVGDDLEHLGDDFLLHHDWKVDYSFIKKLATEVFSVLWILCDKFWTLIRFL